MGVYKRENGIFYVNLVVDGKQIRKSTGCRTKKEAEKIALQIHRQMLEDKDKPKVTRLTLSQAFERAYDERWKHHKDGLDTFNRSKLIVEILGDKPLMEITNYDIVRLTQELSKQGRQPATINRYLSFLSVVLNMALRRWGALFVLPYIEKLPEPKGRSEAEEEAHTVVHRPRRSGHG